MQQGKVRTVLKFSDAIIVLVINVGALISLSFTGSCMVSLSLMRMSSDSC